MPTDTCSQSGCSEQDDYKSLDHAMEILRSCVSPYTGEQAQKVAKALKQWQEKWKAAVDLIFPDERQTLADLRAMLADAEADRNAVAVREPTKVMQRTESECMRACIASYFAVPIESVPEVYSEDWEQRISEWCRPMGLGFLSIQISAENFARCCWNGLFIVAGKSRRGHSHAVLYRDGKLWHDPHPEGGGIQSIEAVDVFFNLRTPQPTPAAEEPAAAAPDADSEEVVEQGPSTPTSPERPQGRQLLAQFLDWMNAEFPIDPNYDRFAAIRAGARELLDLTPGTLGQPDANDEGRFSMIQCQFDSVDWIPKATEAIDNLDTRLRAVERELARKGVQ